MKNFTIVKNIDDFLLFVGKMHVEMRMTKK
jgi:hypothetical protein